jgi:hypothetical protein
MKKSVKWHEKYFLLSWRKAWMIPAAWIFSFIMHGVIYGLGIYFFGQDFWGAGGDEPVFFILTVIIIPIYAIAVLVYSLVWLIRKKL